LNNIKSPQSLTNGGVPLGFRKAFLALEKIYMWAFMRKHTKVWKN